MPAPAISNRLDLGGSVLATQSPHEVPAAEAESALGTANPMGFNSDARTESDAFPAVAPQSNEGEINTRPTRQEQAPRLYDPQDRTTMRTPPASDHPAMVATASLTTVRRTASEKELRDARGWTSAK
jgi:hypothetical protein